ncbi:MULTISPECIES: Uma2 family endonuclease [unclassified Moorena]|uniref:Uma2 family endonuclease n=1 Tax=unclassified Moorena TaxID=2683338 RepID=UPI0013FFF6B5|nr:MULTISPECIES: Uma2 family endonuclease [unclassified Moorena]NEO10884.1 Uma2 family endonuclease [Moorena sp. SIO3E8]NEP97425.1 Uma2 family endonuclease [Moorena sp. SIO3F7]
MTVTIPIKAIQLTPGSTITINNLKWQYFETILEELGEKRRVRLTYYQGNLEIMSALAIHERPHRIIADIVKAILNLQGRDWEDFGSTTFKRPEIAGVEPDTCLYIQNAHQMRGCTQMDLDIYPPPDLAIESDVTSKTTLEVYAAIGVPEVWIYSKQQLRIYIIKDGNYQETSLSPTFPNLSLTTQIPQLVEQAINQGTSRMLRELKSQFFQSK